jgi:hypothetical protein
LIEKPSKLSAQLAHLLHMRMREVGPQGARTRERARAWELR